MIAYRISKEKYIKDLSGIGAKLYGGRWNPKGYALVYSSENKALAALEVLVHVDRDTFPDDLKIISLNIPDKRINNYKESKFKTIMTRQDSIIMLKEEGKKWLESKESLALSVPSILIPGEKNILINPNHKSFKEIKILKVEDFVFDERFFI